MPSQKHYIHNPAAQVQNSVVKGQKGDPGIGGKVGQTGKMGQKGSAGLDGHTSTIVGSFSIASPSSLPKSGTLPVGWDDGALTPPTTFLVEVGESLIDTRTGMLWCFTPGSNVSNWTNIGRISGPQGLPGARGETGDRGATGLSGVKGLDGLPGQKGLPGRDGVDGLKGEHGDKGTRGPTGPNGNHGGQGPKGISGSKGERGFDGKDGFLGGDGPEGSKGQKGAAGPQGSRGIQGLNGAAGAPAPVQLLPRVGGSINVTNGGLYDKLNISKTEKLDKGKIRVFFKTPLDNVHYTVMMTTQSGREEEVLSSYIIGRTTTYVDIAVKTSATNDYCNYGIISLVIYKFHS